MVWRPFSMHETPVPGLRAVTAAALAAGLLAIGACSPNRERSQGASLEHRDPAAYSLASAYAYLDQEWSPADRLRFWFTSQGSQVMPYAWFLHLERADGQMLVRDGRNIRRYLFIPYPVNRRWNPDGLPIGFARDVDRRTKRVWVGLTCAACHTGSIVIGNKLAVIDGGPAMADFQAFFQDLAVAMRRTLQDPERFARFARKVQGAGASDADRQELRREFEAETRRREVREAMNRTPHRYGFGRVDAFGQIFNALTVVALKEPRNARPPDAPVSYPVLWGSNQSDIVQWNGLASNRTALGPIARNAGQVIGVFGRLSLAPKRLRYRSSIQLRNLQVLESLVTRLGAPKWPADRLGRLDPKLVAAGRRIFTGAAKALPVNQVCANCHAVRLHGRTGRFFEHRPGRPRIPPRYKANMIPVLRVGTDPKMAVNSLRRSRTGILNGLYKFPPSVPLKRHGATAENVELLIHIVSGILLTNLSRVKRGKREPGSTYDRTREERLRYKARPLDGVWASAPYLHNGSVPTLADLLRPPSTRPKRFCLGTLAFDPVRVGFANGSPAGCRARGGFVFDTRKTGNANSGHRHGTRLTPQQKRQLLEYLKSL